jgi:hypothetical protein
MTHTCNDPAAYGAGLGARMFRGLLRVSGRALGTYLDEQPNIEGFPHACPKRPLTTTV